MRPVYERIPPLVGIVGVCAAGKSTLARGLQERGLDARQISQEHSYVPDMWRRLTNPRYLIYLDCTLETIRARREDAEFPQWLLDAEQTRLAHARQNCDLYVDTSNLTPSEVLARVALPRTGSIVGHVVGHAWSVTPSHLAP